MSNICDRSGIVHGLKFHDVLTSVFFHSLAPAACELGVTCGDVVTPVAPFNVTY
jgi:hypothetical protein